MSDQRCWAIAAERRKVPGTGLAKRAGARTARTQPGRWLRVMCPLCPNRSSPARVTRHNAPRPPTARNLPHSASRPDPSPPYCTAPNSREWGGPQRHPPCQSKSPPVATSRRQRPARSTRHTAVRPTSNMVLIVTAELLRTTTTASFHRKNADDASVPTLPKGRAQSGPTARGVVWRAHQLAHKVPPVALELPPVPPGPSKK